MIDENAKTMTIRSSGKVFKEGDVISINGNTGTEHQLLLNIVSCITANRLTQ